MRGMDHLALVSKALEQLLEDSAFSASFRRAAEAIRRPEKPFIAGIGNGGSLATAEHLANDLQKAAGIPAMALTSGPLFSAYANDLAYKRVFAEQIKGLSRHLTALVAISCSGNSENIIQALIALGSAFRSDGTMSILLTGDGTGKAAELADIVLPVGDWPVQVQEDLHLALCHALAVELESEPIHECHCTQASKSCCQDLLQR